MLTLVLCAALSQAPAKVAVVQSSNLGVPARRAADLTRMLVELLQGEKLDPVEAAGTCDNRACLVAKATELKAPGVISVAFASLGKDTVMDLECVQVSDGRSLAQTTFTVRTGDARLAFEATSFAADVRRALAPSAPPAPPPKVADAPEVTPKLTPDQPAEPEPAVAGEGPKGTQVAAIGLGVGAVGAGVASGVLVYLARTEHVRLGRAVDGDIVHLPEAEAIALRDSANAKYTASLVTLIVAVACVASGIVFGVF